MATPVTRSSSDIFLGQIFILLLTTSEPRALNLILFEKSLMALTALMVWVSHVHASFVNINEHESTSKFSFHGNSCRDVIEENFDTKVLY